VHRQTNKQEKIKDNGTQIHRMANPKANKTALLVMDKKKKPINQLINPNR